MLNADEMGLVIASASASCLTTTIPCRRDDQPSKNGPHDPEASLLSRGVVQEKRERPTHNLSRINISFSSDFSFSLSLLLLALFSFGALVVVSQWPPSSLTVVSLR